MAVLLALAPGPWAGRLADGVRRALSSLGEHVLTRDLEEAPEGVTLALSDHRAPRAGARRSDRDDAVRAVGPAGEAAGRAPGRHAETGLDLPAEA